MAQVSTQHSTLNTQHSTSLDELISQSSQLKKKKELDNFINRCQLFISQLPADDIATQKKCLIELLTVLKNLQSVDKFSNHQNLHSLVSQIKEDIYPNPYSLAQHSLAQHVTSWRTAPLQEADSTQNFVTRRVRQPGFLQGKYASRNNH